MVRLKEAFKRGNNSFHPTHTPDNVEGQFFDVYKKQGKGEVLCVKRLFVEGNNITRNKVVIAFTVHQAESDFEM
ncbi:hypothetical protein KZY93_000676 [Vibrio vulnificus]|nr:hypothetical protein [Vibrio vulnificus]EJD0673062.1 hypothetical protein [Vibrio vulnificus]